MTGNRTIPEWAVLGDNLIFAGLSSDARTLLIVAFLVFAERMDMDLSLRDKFMGTRELYEAGFVTITTKNDDSFALCLCDPETAPQLRRPN